MGTSLGFSELEGGGGGGAGVGVGALELVLRRILINEEDGESKREFAERVLEDNMADEVVTSTEEVGSLELLMAAVSVGTEFPTFPTAESALAVVTADEGPDNPEELVARLLI